MKKAKRQGIYILVNIPFIFLIKVGITNSMKHRMPQINDSTVGFAVPIFYLPIPYAHQVEQLIHALSFWANIKWFGSGKTEWFLLPAIFIALPIILLAAVAEFAFFAAILLALGYLCS